MPGASAKPVRLFDRAEWEACGWAWLGSACTLLTLDSLSGFVETQSDGQYFLLLGSFGAPHHPLRLT